MDQNEVQYIQTAMNRPDIAKTDHEFFINKGIEIYYIVRFVETFKPFKNVKVLKGVSFILFFRIIKLNFFSE